MCTEKITGRISHTFLSTKPHSMRVNPSTDLVFRVNGTEVKHFNLPYIGCLVIIDGGALEDIHTHIKKVNGAFVKLYPVWRNKNILLKTKI